MTTSIITYTLPKLITLSANSFDVAPEFKPELTRLDLGPGNTRRYWPCYRVCYLERCSIDRSISSINTRNNVNLSSLCANRVALIQPMIKAYLAGHSGTPKFTRVEPAFDWIDQQGRSAELDTLEGARKLYRDYTDLLRHRVRLPNIGEATQSIGYPMARELQNAMAYILVLACKREVSVVQSWAPLIPKRSIGLNELPAPKTTAQEHELALAMHHRFFYAFSEAILNSSTPPVVVELKDLGFEDLIYYSQIANNARNWRPAKGGQRTDWKPFFYLREGVFEGPLKEFNTQLAENGIAPVNRTSIKREQINNRQFTPGALRELANHATRHFGYLLLAEAGNNAAHLATIDCEKVRLNKVLGIASTRAIKGRAGFEVQEQHVDIRFAHTIWMQYLKLRDWMCKKLATPPKSGLFILIDEAGNSPYNLLSASSIKALPLWPTSGPSLATREARKHKTVNLLEGSGGNTTLVAKMQFASTQTIERHYNFKNKEEASKEMSTYFAAQAKAVELRHNGVKPARIIKDGDTTHSGFCDTDEDGPRLLEDFENIGIEPRCGAPITCIFCTHFALHADVESMLRLLTIKLWIETQSRLNSMNIDEHFQKFAPYINRIQQILENFEFNDDVSVPMKEALFRFEQGERDHYWHAKIGALLEMEDA